MKKLVYPFTLIIVLTLAIFIFSLTPLSNLTKRENYTVLKSTSPSWEMGGGWDRKFLLRIDNSEQFERDCFSFFSTGRESGDAYFYSSFFHEDACLFSCEYSAARFSETSLRMRKDDEGTIWRFLFSEDKKYCYIHIIRMGR